MVDTQQIEDAKSELLEKGMNAEGVFKATILGSTNDDLNRGDSQQLADPFSELYRSGDAIQPPYNPYYWAALLEISPRLHRLIDLMAKNTVGTGWELYIPKDVEHDPNDPAVRIEKENIEYVLKRPAPLMNLNTVSMLTKIDAESGGQGYLETPRFKESMRVDGRDVPSVSGILHVPGMTVRVRSDGEGYVQIRYAGKRKYFKFFGDKRIMNAETGKFESNSLPEEKRATELIQDRIYSPRSSYYGVPRYVSCSPGINGNYNNSLRNYSFHENDGTPRTIIVVNRGTLGPETTKKVEAFFKTSVKGPKNAGRAIVIEKDASRGNPELKSSGNAIDVIPLTVGVKDDASFLKYQEFNNEELREVFGIGKVFLGTSEGVNRASAVVQRKTTIEQVFIPAQEQWEYMFNRTVVDSFNPQFWQYRLIRPQYMNEVDNSQIIERYAKLGGFTIDDLRKEINKPAFNTAWSQLPLPVVLELLKGGPSIPEEDMPTVDDIGKTIDTVLRKGIESLDERSFKTTNIDDNTTAIQIL